MTIALITSDKKTILQIMASVPSQIRLPSGDEVQGVQVGWSGEGCSLVSVIPFATPSGQQNIGNPSYAFDGSGNVVESYATQPIPVPAPSSVQVNSTGTAALNGVYGIDSASVADIMAEIAYIDQTTAAGSGTFTNGQITKPWADATGTLHTFTIPEFIALAEAVARYVDSVVTAGETAVANNQLPVWPSGPISIP